MNRALPLPLLLPLPLPPITSDGVRKFKNLSMAANTRSTGTVKWFSARKGFGFIAPDDGSEDLFVHQTSIQSRGFRTLSEGQPVEYDVDFGGDDSAMASNVVGVSRSFGILRGRGRTGGRRWFPGGRGRGYNTSGGGGFGRGGRGGRSGGGAACYNCGRYGHLTRDCYKGTAGAGSRRYGGGGGGGGGSCYNCGEEGHFARDCLNTDSH